MKYHYGKNVLVTGGSSGIGLAASEVLAANGYTVFAASRSPSAQTRFFSGGGEIRTVTLDVCNLQSVDAAAEAVQADVGIIIHCAGIGIACPGEDFPPDAVSRLMETNFFGVLRVNSRFLPRLRERGGGLCIMIGSVGGIFPLPFQSHYSASKAALDLYSSALRMELREYGVHVSLVKPGDTNTGFTGAREYVIDETSPYYDACIRAVSKMEKDELGGRPAQSVALAILRLCSQKNPPAHKVVGFDYKLLVLLRGLLPYRLVESILRAVYIK